MALLTTHSSTNLTTVAGKTQRITCGTPTDPALTVSADPSTGEIVTSYNAWYEMICHSTAAFRYGGMTYTAAAACRDAMIAKFTRQKAVWRYSETVVGGKLQIGWSQSGVGTVQEADVQLSRTGGDMWEVSVQVDCEDVKWVADPSTTTFDYPACLSDVR